VRDDTFEELPLGRSIYILSGEHTHSTKSTQGAHTHARQLTHTHTHTHTLTQYTIGHTHIRTHTAKLPYSPSGTGTPAALCSAANTPEG